MEYLEKLLDDLKSGKYKKDFSFSEPDMFEESQSFKDDILLEFENKDSIACQVEWSYYRTKGMRGDGYLTPDDPDVLTLDYISVDNFVFTENEEEYKLEDLHRSKSEKNIFIIHY